MNFWCEQLPSKRSCSRFTRCTEACNTVLSRYSQNDGSFLFSSFADLLPGRAETAAFLDRGFKCDSSPLRQSRLAFRG